MGPQVKLQKQGEQNRFIKVWQEIFKRHNTRLEENKARNNTLEMNELKQQ